MQDERMSKLEKERLVKSLWPFRQLMMQYKCAMLEVETKLQVLNSELSLYGERNPIENISCRIKEPTSIVEKLERKGLAVNVDNIRSHLYDIAGIRVICAFPADIYMLAEKLSLQDDIRVYKRKDYIKEPKANGYRSLHLIVEVPVFFSERKIWLPVEVQFRTIAMDFWASLEHRLNYKKHLPVEFAQSIVDKLTKCAEDIHQMDLRMQEINELIDSYSCDIEEVED